jgi:hypothetical protein
MQDSYYCEACGIVLFWVQSYARLQQVRGDGTAKTTADMILIVKSAEISASVQDFCRSVREVIPSVSAKECVTVTSATKHSATIANLMISTVKECNKEFCLGAKTTAKCMRRHSVSESIVSTVKNV